MGLQVNSVRAAKTDEFESIQSQDTSERNELGQEALQSSAETSRSEGKQGQDGGLPNGYRFRASSIDEALTYNPRFSDLQMPKWSRPAASNVQSTEHDATSIKSQVVEVEQRRREAAEAAEAAHRLVVQASRLIASEVAVLSAAVSSVPSVTPTGKINSSVGSDAPATTQRAETVDLATARFSRAMSEIYRAQGALLEIASSIASKDAALSANYGIVVDGPSLEGRGKLSEVASLVAGQSASLALHTRTLQDEFQAALAA